MRIASESSGGIQPGYPSTAASAQSTQNSDSTTKVLGTESSFDQVDISTDLPGETKFRRELAAHLVQDVRTATSTGVIQQLKEQVRGGAYAVDPESIASAMLLEN